MKLAHLIFKACSVRILLVEDNPVNQKLASTMLSKAGYKVEVANDGRAAVVVNVKLGEFAKAALAALSER